MATITLTTSGPRLIRLARSLSALGAAYPTDQNVCVVVIDDSDWSVTDSNAPSRKIKH